MLWCCHNCLFKDDGMWYYVYSKAAVEQQVIPSFTFEGERATNCKGPQYA